MNSEPTPSPRSSQPEPNRTSISRSFLPRLLNAWLWLVFCGMAGTGLLLAFRLPPGSRGGQGLSAWGLTRHEWGDLHTWLSYAFIALIVAHLILHWRWLWQVAGRRRSIPLLAGFGLGLAVIAAITFAPVSRKSGGRGGENRSSGGEESQGMEANARRGGGGGGGGLQRRGH